VARWAVRITQEDAAFLSSLKFAEADSPYINNEKPLPNDNNNIATMARRIATHVGSDAFGDKLLNGYKIVCGYSAFVGGCIGFGFGISKSVDRRESIAKGLIRATYSTARGGIWGLVFGIAFPIAVPFVGIVCLEQYLR
jgi:hypothetical protein